MKYNIAVIMGGFSEEYDISIQSGHTVIKHLSKTLYDVFPIVITQTSWYYKGAHGDRIEINKSNFSIDQKGHTVCFDLVFNVIHGSPGEDGQLQAYFHLIGIPQTSCGFSESVLTFSKKDTLAVLKYHGVKVADSFYLRKDSDISQESIIKAVGLPCFVKPNQSGSSIGVSKVLDASDLIPSIEKAFNVDNHVLIETALEGMEVSVGIVPYKGLLRVLPITEIVSFSKSGFFDYDAKYKGASQEITPARISSDLEKKIKDLTLYIYRTLGIRGFARSEFILVKGVPYFLEINTTPGLTEESLLPQQLECEGISLSALFNDLISQNLKKNV